jgi:hypothetical protein
MIRRGLDGLAYYLEEIERLGVLAIVRPGFERRTAAANISVKSRSNLNRTRTIRFKPLLGFYIYGQSLSSDPSTLGGLTTSKPALCCVCSAETMLDLRADTAPLTLCTVPCKAAADLFLVELAGLLVTLGFTAALGVRP